MSFDHTLYDFELRPLIGMNGNNAESDHHQKIVSTTLTLLLRGAEDHRIRQHLGRGAVVG
jgi:hypothetical protein